MIRKKVFKVEILETFDITQGSEEKRDDERTDWKRGYVQSPLYKKDW